MLQKFKSSSLRQPICTKTLTKDILSIRNCIQEEILTYLQNEQLTITLAFDGGKIQNNKVFNILLLEGINEIYWKTIVHNIAMNPHHDHTFLANEFIPILNNLIANDIKIVAVTHDNEELNYATFKELKVSFPFLIECPCICHIINLIVRDILEIPLFEST